VITEEELEKYVRAGRIAKAALEYGVGIVRSRRRVTLLELAEMIERKIVELGGRPAFPCNIGVNEVAAHYTPLGGEEHYLPEEGLVKIDVGVHVDGYIADTAVTVPLSSEYSEIVEVNREVLEKMIGAVRVGVRVGELGRIAEETAKKHGYLTIANLTGHLVDRYNLHAGKHIPNVWQFLSPRIERFEVYAIEPFLTFGDASGYVKEIRGNVRIYSISRIKREKDRRLEQLRREIMARYNKLPFTPRWLASEYGEDAYRGVEELYRRGALRGYPVLVERNGRPVSQFEHTVVIYGDEVIVTTA